MSDTEKKPKPKETFIRNVSASTIQEALQHLDDMQRSFYDMYVISAGRSESFPDYMSVKVYSWENETTRELFSC